MKGGSVEVSPVHLKMTGSRRELLEESLEACRDKMEAVELESKAVAERLKDATQRLLEARSGLHRRCRSGGGRGRLCSRRASTGSRH